jgi:hypothetical protein
MRTYQKQCGRCGGSRYVRGGVCFNCRGAGEVTVIVYTAEEKRANADAFQRAQDALGTLRAFAATELNKQDGWDMATAFGHLRDHSPERFARLLTSVESGHARTVAHALLAYYTDTVCEGEEK